MVTSNKKKLIALVLFLAALIVLGAVYYFNIASANTVTLQEHQNVLSQVRSKSVAGKFSEVEILLKDQLKKKMPDEFRYSTLMALGAN